MKIGFVGFGHMAGAMVKGLIRAGHNPADFFVAASDREKLRSKAEALGISPADNKEVAENSDIVFISVKPGTVPEVMKEILLALTGGKKILVSVAFGYDFEKLEELLGEGSEVPHISIIPNTPCEVCQGITLLEEKHNLSEEELGKVEAVLKDLGEIEYLPTSKLWLGGELSSCGPAFAAMFIEALGDAGAKYGLEKEAAYRIVSQMVAGTGRLQIEEEKDPGEMVTEVATPGGVTIKGVTAMKEAGFAEVVAKAIDAIEEGK